MKLAASIGLIALVSVCGCGGRAASRTPAAPPPLSAEEMGIVVENAGPVDVEAWVTFFGGAERRVGLIPAGTERGFSTRHVDQDFSLVLVVAGSRVLGTSGQVVGSPSIPRGVAGDVYYVHVPPNGPIAYAKNGRPPVADAGTGGSAVTRWVPTLIVAVGLVFLVRALLNLESN